MSHYLVTAVLQDNREFTVKCCARCINPWEAMDAIKKAAASRVRDLNPEVDPLQVVEETWAVLFMHIEYVEETMS